MKRRTIISFLPLILFSVFVYSAEQEEYLSPDGAYRAIVVTLSKAPYGSGESEIFIKSKDEEIICSKNYQSEDGEHGYGVEKAAWTPDSKFFVYSMSSSGGHQAWHFPTDFIAIADFKIYSLDDYVGPVTNPDFVLAAPDIINTVGQDKITLEETNFKVSLSQTMKDENTK